MEVMACRDPETEYLYVVNSIRKCLEQGVPAEKIAIGSPLYSHGWKMNDLAEETVGVPAEPIDDLTWHEILAREQAAVPERLLHDLQEVGRGPVEAFQAIVKSGDVCADGGHQSTAWRVRWHRGETLEMGSMPVIA